MLTPLMWAIEAGDDPADDEEITVKFHPAIPIYLGCRRFGHKAIAADGTVLITPLLPYAGTYLDQDAELMLAFEVLDEVMAEIEESRAARQKNQESAAALRQVR